MCAQIAGPYSPLAEEENGAHEDAATLIGTELKDGWQNVTMTKSELH